MNLTGLLKYLQNKFSEDERIGKVFVDSPYECWNRKNDSSIYTSAVIDFENSTFQDGYQDYNFVVYVGSVINEQQTNIYPIMSTSDSIISTVLHKIDTEDNGFNLVVPAVITPFVQSFADVNAGCWCRITIRITFEPLC